NTTGGYNFAIGWRAGANLTTGSNNIDIFDPGVAGESDTIRLGTQGTQTAAPRGGSFKPSVSNPGSAMGVVVDNTGNLGAMPLASLVGPTGPAGATGATGAVGPTGVAGATGATGPAGGPGA